MNQRSIIIVGGGVSGLMAARMLSHTYKVTLIEQRNQLGGRIRTIHSGAQIIEGGAEFMHGDLPLTIELLKEAGLHYVKAEGRMFKKEGTALKEQTEMVEGWDEFFKQIKKESVDITLDNFLAKHFSDTRHAEFRQEVRRYAMGFDVADPKDASALSLYNEWSHEGNNYRIKEGYGALIHYLEKECRKNGCEIILEETVKEVNHVKNKVEVISVSGTRYHANQILITLPVNNLFDHIHFLGIVNHYITASKQIGFGSVIKVIVEFKRLLWQTDAAFIFSEELIPTWWTQYPLTGHTLTGWVGGPMADNIAGQTDDELKQATLQSLANIFNMSIDQLEQQVDIIHVFNWKSGAYSYATTQSQIARNILNTPIDNTIFFAGEGLYHGKYSGTVEAALSSAKQASQKILSSQLQ
jgi:monoamine oxidase